MQAKHLTIKTVFAHFLETIEWSTLQNAFVGSCNLYADFLNDFSNERISDDLANFLWDNKDKLDYDDFSSCVENPDNAIRNASSVFFDSIAQLFDGNYEWCESFRKLSHTWFDAWGNYYFYVNQYANAGQDLFIIRAGCEHDAFEELTSRFEKFFAIDEEDLTEEEKEHTLMNDQGTYINTDYLVFVGSLEFVKD